MRKGGQKSVEQKGTISKINKLFDSIEDVISWFDCNSN